MENQHRHIKGYRELTAVDISKMNEVKALAEEVGDLINGLETASALPRGMEPDKRWLAIAKTQLQQGFMALTRAIAKPETF